MVSQHFFICLHIKYSVATFFFICLHIKNSVATLPLPLIKGVTVTFAFRVYVSKDTYFLFSLVFTDVIAHCGVEVRHVGRVAQQVYVFRDGDGISAYGGTRLHFFGVSGS